MKRDILQEDMSMKQMLGQLAFGAIMAFGLLAAAAVWDALMHLISGC